MSNATTAYTGSTRQKGEQFFKKNGSTGERRDLEEMPEHDREDDGIGGEILSRTLRHG